MSPESVAEILLELGAVELRSAEPWFTFASGIKSPIYTDNRLTISDPSARDAIRDGFAEHISQLRLEPDVIAGTATAGIPHAAFLADKLGLPMVYVRGAAKGHGKQNRVEGRLQPGAKVLLIEDLISTGGSSVSAAEALRDEGAEVIHVLAIFAYGFESARKKFADAGFPYSSLVSFNEVVQHAARRGDIDPKAAQLIREWSASPSDWPGGASEAEVRQPDERLIVAADLADRGEIDALAKGIAGVAGYIKFNSAFLVHGAELVESAKKLGLKVFLDLKFHDIPNTVANYCRAAASMGVSMLTIHAGGGPAMIRAAADAVAGGEERPKVLAVTALTSMSDSDLEATGIAGGRDGHVTRLAKLAADSGADGIVCSVAEAPAVRSACGPDFVIVTPGVRPAGGSTDDHARSATPTEAIAAGADHIVIGRPVYGADVPGGAAENIAAELSSATR